MEWYEKIVGGFIGLCVLVIGFFLKSRNLKIEELEAQMTMLLIQKADREDLAIHRAEDTQRFESLQLRFREDIKDIHKKIEDGQKETNRRLDTIIDKLTK